VKRSYALRSDGAALELAAAQDALRTEPELLLDDDGAMLDLLDDSDMVAPKPATDVVVSGTVRLDEAATRHRVAVAAGNSHRIIELVGERRASVPSQGAVRFSAPEPFEQLELHRRHAYGGHDVHAQLRLDGAYRMPNRRPPPGFVPSDIGIFAYPRNAIGTGYFIDLDRRRADGAALPRIEDPDDRLQPESFFVPTPEAWVDAPIAANLGWVPHSDFPRIARLLGPALACAEPNRPLREASFADGSDLAPLSQLSGQQVAPRALQGAAPGLACERLRGDELVVLEGLLADAPNARFLLPGEVPDIELLVPDVGAQSTKAVLQTVRIDLDRGVVSLTWCGAMRLVAPASAEFLSQCAPKVRWRRT
jgi:hypothetical protein